MWKNYKKIAKKYQLYFDLIDDAVSTLLFWLPHRTNPDEVDNNGCDEIAAWREMWYGVLSLHRLSMHLALQEEKYDDHENN